MTDEYTYPGQGNMERDEGRACRMQLERDTETNTYRLKGTKPATSVEKMARLLDDAKEIVSGSRHEAYGDPIHNHHCTALMWTAYLHRLGVLKDDRSIEAKDVCFLNILQKCSREAHWSQRENSVDIAGYAANAEPCRPVKIS